MLSSQRPNQCHSNYPAADTSIGLVGNKPWLSWSWYLITGPETLGWAVSSKVHYVILLKILVAWGLVGETVHNQGRSPHQLPSSLITCAAHTVECLILPHVVDDVCWYWQDQIANHQLGCKDSSRGSDGTCIKISIQWPLWWWQFEHFIDVMIGFCDVEMGLRRWR